MLVFNTGRLNVQRERTLTQLTDAGYDVATCACARRARRSRTASSAAATGFINDGYTLIANVGNNPTDFAGDGYEKAYRLPNYGGELG